MEGGPGLSVFGDDGTAGGRREADSEGEFVKEQTTTFEGGFVKVRPGWYGVENSTEWVFLFYLDQRSGGANWLQVSGASGTWYAGSSYEFMRDLVQSGMRPVRQFGASTPLPRQVSSVYFCSVQGCAGVVTCQAISNHGDVTAGTPFCGPHGEGFPGGVSPSLPVKVVTARDIAEQLAPYIKTTNNHTMKKTELLEGIVGAFMPPSKRSKGLSFS